MKKLLLLGNNKHVDTLISLAKERGVYTIVTDNLSVEQSPCKLMADEYWDINVTDIDLLEKKSIENDITAVLCGAGELCMEASRELCKRLRLPFYVSDRAWEVTNNKILFKNECIKCNIPVPKTYRIDLSSDCKIPDDISYPVVVKPSDSCASLGLHICETEKELIDGFKDAYEKSPSGEVVVEEFCRGTEFMLVYSFVNGKMTLVEHGECYGDLKLGLPFIYCESPSKNIGLLTDRLTEPLKKLFAELDCKDGIAAIQGILDKDKVSVFEMNYRLPGIDYVNSKYCCNILLDFVLEDKMTNANRIAPEQKYIGYYIWLRKGRIETFKGLDIIKEEAAVLIYDLYKKTGDEIKENSGMRQILLRILFDAEKETIAHAFKVVNDNLVVLDEKGNDMAYRYDYMDGRFVLRKNGK